MSEPQVDLRSDTVTRPTPAMKQAMMTAELGDDVFGDDPTVHALERRVAELTGKEASLFVPSGTMGNQLAIAAQTTPGDEVLLDADAHIVLYERGGLSANSGCLAHTVRTERGELPVAAIEAAVRGENDHVAPLTLVCVENTHNMHGGAVLPLARLRGIGALAHERGLRVHLDGARLWNASVATGVPLRDWAAGVDTVMMCFSKALGAPVGSILASSGAVIARARQIRKRWGGGMRQSGLLAAACLYAIDHHVARLADDHARARRLAEGFAAPGVRVTPPETNIVFATFEDPALDPGQVLALLERRGVRMSRYGPRRLRAVTHLDVDDAGITRAIDAFHDALAVVSRTP